MKRIILIIVMTLLTGGFFIPAFAQVIEPTPPTEPFSRNTVANIEPVPYTHVREADVFWSKKVWRVIDMREKINQPLYYPISPINNRKNLMTVILEGLEENQLRAFTSDQLDVPYTYEEIMERLQTPVTVTLQRPEPPYEDYDTTYLSPFKPESVMTIRLMEVWFFDKERSVLECRIMAMCPVRFEYDDYGEYKGARPMFWISFPEARKLFATNEVFNRQSDVERRSFDDVFFKRMFSSYIYKESNVYDRPILDYALGVDGLLESERIKEEIFMVEHDLWEY